MSVQYVVGDLFDAVSFRDSGFTTEKAPTPMAIGHGVNSQGSMAGGIAKEFARRYPDMRDNYADLCERGRIRPGRVLIHGASDHYVMNMVTQVNPGADASYRLVDEALDNTIRVCKSLGIETLAIPQIGCGIGGLLWGKVKGIIEENATHHNFNIQVWALDDSLLDGVDEDEIAYAD